MRGRITRSCGCFVSKSLIFSGIWSEQMASKYENTESCREGVKQCISIFFILFMLLGCDENKNSNQSNLQDNRKPDNTEAKANRIRVSVSLTVEPYVIKAVEPGGKDSGFELDIVKEILLTKGYSPEFVYEPLQRSKMSFENHLVDAVMDVKDYYPEVQGSFFSDEHITYHNYIVTLRSSNISISSANDIRDKNVIAFQQASLALGEEFKSMTSENPNYLEMGSQSSQITMLFLGRTDAIVLDRHIFRYHRARLKSVNARQPVDYHELFPPSRFRIAFKEKTVRDDFNVGLKEFRASGRYQFIIDSYLAKENYPQ